MEKLPDLPIFYRFDQIGKIGKFLSESCFSLVYELRNTKIIEIGSLQADSEHFLEKLPDLPIFYRFHQIGKIGKFLPESYFSLRYELRNTEIIEIGSLQADLPRGGA